VSFSPDGKWLASSGFDSDVSIWDLNTGKLAKKIPGTALKVAFSPDGKWLAIGRGKICLHDTTDWREVASVEKQEYGHRGIVFTPDSKTMITACGRYVRIFDLAITKAEKSQ